MNGVLQVLPPAVDTAARNMALDRVLLEAYPAPELPRLRTYGWAEPAATFGYGQSWQELRACLPDGLSLVRRQTGGGLVDHRNDYTYALVVPARHPWHELTARTFYLRLHATVAKALEAAGAPNRLAPCDCDAPAGRASACFTRPEPGDVVDPEGRKLAGAALKRTREGLLAQGSLDRAAAPQVDWQVFTSALTSALAEALDATPEAAELPQPPVLESWVQLFASPAWNQRR